MRLPRCRPIGTAADRNANYHKGCDGQKCDCAPQVRRSVARLALPCHERFNGFDSVGIRRTPDPATGRCRFKFPGGKSNGVLRLAALRPTVNSIDQKTRGSLAASSLTIPGQVLRIISVLSPQGQFDQHESSHRSPLFWRFRQDVS